MSIEELRAIYSKMEDGEEQNDKENDEVVDMNEDEDGNGDESDSDQNEEFVGEDEQDDETTLIEEEVRACES